MASCLPWMISWKERMVSFQEIIQGKHDAIPESYFLFKGSIDDVVEAFKKDQVK